MPSCDAVRAKVAQTKEHKEKGHKLRMFGSSLAIC